MNLKQLEYFTIVAEQKSINKAAELLYTTQPNVSKVISSLEKELKSRLFDRSNKGVRLTNYGKEVYDYAKIILKNQQIILTLNDMKPKKTLSVACYPSHIISRVICDYYNSNEDIKINFLEGTVEEIIKNVSSYICEIGIVYIIDNKRCCLNHILEHKNMEFEEISIKKTCIYVGKQNKFYDRKEINIEELFSLNFIQSVKDIFSMEDYLEIISDNVEAKTKNVITTNSDNLIINMLLTTDVASFGVKLTYDKYQQYDIRAIDITNNNDNIYIGFIKRKGEKLSEEALEFLDLVKKII